MRLQTYEAYRYITAVPCHFDSNQHATCKFEQETRPVLFKTAAYSDGTGNWVRDATRADSRQENVQRTFGTAGTSMG